MAAGDLTFTSGVLRYRDSANTLIAAKQYTSVNITITGGEPAASGYAEGQALLRQGTYNDGGGATSGIIWLIKYGTTWKYHAFAGPLFADAAFPNVAGTGVLYIAGANLCLQYGGQRYTIRT